MAVKQYLALVVMHVGELTSFYVVVCGTSSSPRSHLTLSDRGT